MYVKFSVSSFELCSYLVSSLRLSHISPMLPPLLRSFLRPPSIYVHPSLPCTFSTRSTDSTPMPPCTPFIACPSSSLGVEPPLPFTPPAYRPSTNSPFPPGSHPSRASLPFIYFAFSLPFPSFMMTPSRPTQHMQSPLLRSHSLASFYPSLTHSLSIHLSIHSSSTGSVFFFCSFSFSC